jgi:hypothetical protein
MANFSNKAMLRERRKGFIRVIKYLLDSHFKNDER